jgi:putative transposase
MANQASYPVRLMCRLLGVSASGYYVGRDRPRSRRALSDIALTAQIHAIHERSRESYGAPRVHAELIDAYGLRVGHNRVAL